MITHKFLFALLLLSLIGGTGCKNRNARPEPQAAFFVSADRVFRFADSKLNPWPGEENRLDHLLRSGDETPNQSFEYEWLDSSAGEDAQEGLLILRVLKNASAIPGISPRTGDLWLIGTDHITRLHDSVFNASLSPDGKKIAWTTEAGEMIVADAEGKTLASVSERVWSQLPVWNPDGNQIYFSQSPPTESGLREYRIAHLAALDLPTGKIEQLTPSGALDYQPLAFGKTHMLFVSQRSGEAGFHSIKLNLLDPPTALDVPQGWDAAVVPRPGERLLLSTDTRTLIHEHANSMGNQSVIWRIDLESDQKISATHTLGEGRQVQWLVKDRSVVFLDSKNDPSTIELHESK